MGIKKRNMCNFMKKTKNISSSRKNYEKIERIRTSMSPNYNKYQGSNYQVILDTNFINFSIVHKIDIFQGLTDCLQTTCTLLITECVIAELEKLGRTYRVALKIAKDPRFERLTCHHRGTYVDDCLISRVQQHKCFLIATCDKNLQRRLRKIPHVPIVYLKSRRVVVERLF